MKYVHRIEDAKMWRDQFEDSAKGKANARGGYYVVNQTGKGDSVGYIPNVAQDIVMAKAKIRKRRYKKRTKKIKKQTKTKTRRGRKVRRKTVKRKSNKRKKTKRK